MEKLRLFQYNGQSSDAFAYRYRHPHTNSYLDGHGYWHRYLAPYHYTHSDHHINAHIHPDTQTVRDPRTDRHLLNCHTRLID